MPKDKEKDTASEAPLPEDPNWPRDLKARLARVSEATMEVTIELGRSRVPLKNVLNAKPGVIFETSKLSGQPMEVMVNGSLFGRGEVVVIGDNLAIRMTELAKPGEV